MTYWSILEKMRGSQLRLTRMDDEIYDHLMKEFPDFDPAATINEDEMKSKQGKEKWRNFMNQYEKKVADYNFGTILRANAKDEYEQDTTIFGKASFILSCSYIVTWLGRLGTGLADMSDLVPRMQFYAVEIAR